MQFQNVIALTSTQLIALANPGAAYIEVVQTDQAIVAGEAVHACFHGGELLVQPDSHVGGRLIPLGSNGSGQPGNAVLALSRLRTFRSWGPDWDGEGAPAPDPAALKSATVMLGLLSSALGYAPNVALNGDGEPTFTVMRGDFELQVSMASDSEAVYLVAYGSEERAGLAEFDGRYLPAELQTALSELRHIAV